MAHLEDLHVTIRAEFLAKCKHGIEHGQCLSIECVKHPDIPVRGEKSWDSRLQPQSGGTYPNHFQSVFRSLTVSNPFMYPSSNPVSIRFTSQYLNPFNPSPSRPEPTTETRELPVIGYRGWRVQDVVPVAKSIGPRAAARQVAGQPTIELVSVNQQFGPWDRSGVTKAICRGGHDHKAPAFYCECGLYVLSSLAAAPRWYAEHGVPEDVVIGAVVGWGEVIQHGDEGWRAEFARPIAFLKTDLFHDQPLLHRAAEQYGVPILERRGLELYAKEYGGSFEAPK